ncbi:zf-CHCC domain-containing protein [Meloidogyne graminicola]|uniref:Zf-CHCC domain-containing protein n=1 Tax=Meloidogyne graminicola TaxID=189291 RepID=A0A8S9ZZS9_9BILA|nr:zf-CHCC domain-containing protein [Meloidogyne graminicola]
MPSPSGWMRQLYTSFKDLRIKKPSKQVVAVMRKPSPSEIVTDKSSSTTQFDQITHTGQAWDGADYRLARFEYSAKQVNSNVAAHLVADHLPIPSERSVVFCDGGHTHGGHPKVFINLDKPGTHACGYCGARFYNVHSTGPENMKRAHIQV